MILVQDSDTTPHDGTDSPGGGLVGARLAAATFVIIGALAMTVGGLLSSFLALNVMSGAAATCVGIVCGLQVLFLGAGVLIAIIGLVHLAAAWGTWRRRSWGRWVGAVLAVPGFVLAGSAWLVEVSSRQFALPWVPFIVAYAVALMGLWRWDRRLLTSGRRPRDPP